MSEEHEVAITSVKEKVIDLFREIVPDRVVRLDGSRPAMVAMSAIGSALRDSYRDDIAHDIAFHLADWNWDAAFLVALHIFPERFTASEISAGIGMMIIHAPNHLVAAAKLSGNPVSDIFNVGRLTSDADH